jgi:hypothetical protein
MVHALEQTRVTPGREPAIHGAPGWEVGGQQAPGAARAQHVGDRVDHLPHRPGARAALVARWRQQRLQETRRRERRIEIVLARLLLVACASQVLRARRHRPLAPRPDGSRRLARRPRGGGRIDVLFAIERGLNGLPAPERRAARQRESAPLVADLEAWLRDQRARLSRSSPVAEPIDCMLRRWPAFIRFLDDGRACLSNNAAERALRGFALGRKAWLFAGSDRGAERAAAVATLLVTAKLNDIDPQAWLADVLTRIADHPAHRLDDLLPWHWRSTAGTLAQAA